MIADKHTSSSSVIPIFRIGLTNSSSIRDTRPLSKWL